MTKNNNRKNKQYNNLKEKKQRPSLGPRKKQQIPQTTTSYVKIILVRGWKVFAGIVLLFGLLVTFYPKIEVSSSPPPSDPSKILLTPFVVTNKGLIPVYDLDVLMALKEIKLSHKKLKIVADKEFTAMFLKSNSTLPNLKNGEEFTVSNPFIYQLPPDVINEGAEYADIAIVVRFKPVQLPFTMERIFRFKTSTNADGKLTWYKQRMSAKSFF